MVEVALFAAFAVGFVRWRAAVILALFLAVAEGALRKWAFPDSQQYVYLVKDLLLLGAYVAYFGRRFLRGERLLPPHPANPALALFVVLAVLEVANPELPTLNVGLFGLRAYLMYVPLMYMVPAVFPDAGALRKFWLAYLLLALIPLSLGPVQFNEPRDSWLNRYAWAEEPGRLAITFGSSPSPRVTGTFSFITGYTSYLQVILIVGLAMVLFERRFWLRTALCALVGLGAWNLLMTGSRGPFVILAAAVPLLFLIAAARTRARVAPLLLGAVVAIPVLTVLWPAVFPEEAGREFLMRARGTDSVIARVLDGIRGPWDAWDHAGTTGYGIGSTHQALAFVAPGVGTVAPPAENEWERIVLELGPLGFVLTILIRILVVARLWKAVESADAVGQPFVASALVVALAMIPGNLVFNHTAAVLYWFMAGVAFVPAVPLTVTAREPTSTPIPATRAGARAR